jgi:hypothetical protein
MSIHHEEESDCDNTSFDNFLVDSPLKVILHLGSYIYIYLCNQCISPLGLLVLIPDHGEGHLTTFCAKFVSDILQVDGLLQVLLFPPPI